MKLYTEEQVRQMIDAAHNGIYFYDDILKKHTPIELPSDEEIEIESENYALQMHPHPKMITWRKYCADDFKQGVKYILNKTQGGNK